MTKHKKAAVDQIPTEEVSVDVPSPPTEPSAVPEPVVPPAPSDVELRQRLEEAEQRARDLFMRLQYTQADLENVRKRAERDVVDAVRFADERLLGSLLPVLDEFDAAAASVDLAATGMGMVRDHLVKLLREAGLEEVPTDGGVDPYLHEAVGRVNDPTRSDGSITEVVQKGYRLNFKLLRPAKVIVVRKEGES